METFSILYLMWFFFFQGTLESSIFCVKFRVKSKIYFDGLDIIRQAERYR